MNERVTLNHSDEVSGITILGPGRLALWSEGRSSTVDLFEIPMMEISDESYPDFGAMEYRPVPASSNDPVIDEMNEVLETCDCRMMTETEEMLYNILRNVRKG